jgi:hypothetical protein
MEYDLLTGDMMTYPKVSASGASLAVCGNHIAVGLASAIIIYDTDTCLFLLFILFLLTYSRRFLRLFDLLHCDS